ncbi:MAG: phosphonate ABC transporter, permease protein PhnE [Pseudomonadota bacterium]|nr:phosphonate ABC transporter, permease protein PhnE [Pseudomonadota bacterium]
MQASQTIQPLPDAVDRLMRRKRLISIGLPIATLAYLVMVYFALGIPSAFEKAKWKNGAILIADSVSYKTMLERNNRGGQVKVSIENEKSGTYKEDNWPSWISRDGDTIDVILDGGFVVVINDDNVILDVPDYGIITTTVSRRGLAISYPDDGAAPDWVNASKTRFTATLPNGRLTITKSKTTVFKYSAGWELFFFTMDSPYYGKSWGEILSLALGGDLMGIVSDVWNNKIWHHSKVVWAIGETILMAFLGTIGAALISLPLAFLAAINFSPAKALRFGSRRLFDFLRGVDHLVWTIILSRAFGPGPMTGALAMLITDIGSFGKLFSEALENVDNKQIEGVESTGAKGIEKYRFGVIPQIMPVLLSQVLYYLESNTRSATVIGAIVGAGIGLLLTQAIITQKNWEEVTYYLVLIVLMVMIMDFISGKIRGWLIHGGK